jgi:hypothetical protein
MTDESLNELEYAIRCALYESRRDTFGCKVVDCTCGRHLSLPGYEEPDTPMLGRVRFLVKIEMLQGAGCTFLLNDLDRDTWNELIALKQARFWIDEQVDAQRDRIRQAQELEKKATDEIRKELHIPGPGQSLFK